MEKPPSPRRYLPGLFLLLLAVGLTIRISNEPVRPTQFSASPELGKTGGTRPFKSRERNAPDFTFPQLRAPVTVRSIDELPITVAEARDEMKITESYYSDIGRGTSVSTIIRRLCRSGLEDEAWKCIEQTPGDARLLEIEAFFLSVPWADDVVIGKIRSFPESADRGAAFAAYLNRVPLAALKAVILASAGLENDFRAPLDKVLVSRLFSDRTAAVPLIKELHDLNLGGHLAWAQTVVDDPAIDAFEKWKVIRTALANTHPAGVRAAWNELLPKMTTVDPVQTAQVVINASRNDAPNYMFRQVISQWMLENPVSARQWIAEQTPTATPQQLDDIDWAIAVSARQIGDSSEALNRLDSIRDPDTKSRLSRLLDMRVAGPNGK